jgi:hypothetical protein
VACSCENSNRLSSSIKDGEFIDYLSDYYPVTKDFLHRVTESRRVLEYSNHSSD